MLPPGTLFAVLIMRPLDLCVLCLLLIGCGGNAVPVAESTPAPPEAVPAPVSSVQSPVVASEAEPPSMAPPSIPSISLSGTPAPSTNSVNASPVPATGAGSVTTGAESRRVVLKAMDPLQIMLGSWRGTTQKPVGDFKGLDEPNWVWDFKTDRDHPSMVMKSESGHYFREARLTYVPERDLYQLSAIDSQGKSREFEGAFEQPVERFQGDDDRMHLKYKLTLEQTNGESPRDTWQVVFNQQENNRYLMELGRQQSGRFQRFDTVATQRQGTSFAKRDDDYGEKTCLISGGLGTMQVSYKGKNYWVCCTGCKAAFDEDPQTWVAEFEARQQAK